MGSYYRLDEYHEREMKKKMGNARKYYPKNWKFKGNSKDEEYHEKEVRGMTECPQCVEEQYKDWKQKQIGKDGGLKNDAEKPRWDLIPLETIERVVNVMTYGAKKYAPNNWKKVEVERNFAAMMRHIVNWLKGENIDKDSGFHPLEHALCDLVFIVWKVLDEK